ncbi:hypothetical protein T11_15626 [Trichinella zimbabwensis]|uniref:Transthyretin-like protein 46 n=1 Tax=Trichinella zimbabwensis TaxID=268475 RepID=A0A0V1HJD5_9BILA|nr:hypothetical protein T11_15626 [Trichinella zimbabwensis]
MHCNTVQCENYPEIIINNDPTISFHHFTIAHIWNNLPRLEVEKLGGQTKFHLAIVAFLAVIFNVFSSSEKYQLLRIEGKIQCGSTKLPNLDVDFKVNGVTLDHFETDRDGEFSLEVAVNDTSLINPSISIWHTCGEPLEQGCHFQLDLDFPDKIESDESYEGEHYDFHTINLKELPNSKLVCESSL